MRSTWHRPGVDRLAALDDPSRFLAASFRATAGNLATASAFLPRATREEGRLAYLCCRALDAYEDLAQDAFVSRKLLDQGAAFLAGRSAHPPQFDGSIASRRADRMETLIASRVSVLRSRIDALADPGRLRVRALIDDVAAAMVDLADARRSKDPLHAAAYGERILGRIAGFAFELLGMPCRWPVDTGTLGRAAQAANDLRDWRHDRNDPTNAPTRPFLTLLLELLQAAANVPAALGSPAFPPISRRRAAVLYLVATTSRSCLRALGLQPVGYLRAPLLTSCAAWVHPPVYARFLVGLEGTIAGCAVAAGAPAVGGPGQRADTVKAAVSSRGRRQSDFETALAMTHPVRAHALALSRAVGMAKTAMRLRAFLPAARMEAGRDDSTSSAALMLADYLLGSAVMTLSPLGSEALREFAEFVAAECESAERRGAGSDEHGEFAAVLSRIVSSARGIAGAEAEAAEHRDRRRALAFHLMDRRPQAHATG